jgi:hypothetical protein
VEKHGHGRAESGVIPAPPEFFAISDDGQIRRVVVHAKPILDTSNAVIGVMCCLTDISDKRRLQEQIHDLPVRATNSSTC